jgi:6-phospho-3-hexuloisomerase
MKPEKDEERLLQVIEQVAQEVNACVRRVRVDDLAPAAVLVEEAPRIFVAGAGRSGLCMRSFAMRLMHLGKRVHMVGATTTPGIAAGDLMIVGSGSGRTASLLVMTERARRQEAQILLFTAHEESPLAAMADHRIIIPAPTHKGSAGEPSPSSIQPMGALFEQALLIVSDGLVMELMRRMEVDVAQMSERHANLE